MLVVVLVVVVLLIVYLTDYCVLCYVGSGAGGSSTIDSSLFLPTLYVLFIKFQFSFILNHIRVISKSS